MKSVRGAKGGYHIAGKPSKYTIGMVLRVTEGSLSPVACLDSENEECERCDTCETVAVWRELNDAINQVVDGVTIADLVERQQQREM